MGWRPGEKPAPSLTSGLKRRRPVLAERIGGGGASQRLLEDEGKAVPEGCTEQGTVGRTGTGWECPQGQLPSGVEQVTWLLVGRRGWKLGILAQSGCGRGVPHRCQVRLGGLAKNRWPASRGICCTEGLRAVPTGLARAPQGQHNVPGPGAVCGSGTWSSWWSSSWSWSLSSSLSSSWSRVAQAPQGQSGGGWGGEGPL